MITLEEFNKDELLSRIGKHLLEKEDYETLNELEAIYRYLIDKYGWLPSQVKDLTKDDLKLLVDGLEKVKIVP